MNASSLAASQGKTGPLEQLVYVSIGVIRVSSALQMADILTTARPNNARDGISGALTAVDGSFIQIIEGERAALDHLLGRLLADDRHRDLTVLERRAIRHRAFPGWDMLSPRLAVEETRALSALLDDDQAGLNDYIPVMSRALGRQAALIENAGLESASRAPAGVKTNGGGLSGDQPGD